jgi:DNA replication protein DnaC
LYTESLPPDIAPSAGLMQSQIRLMKASLDICPLCEGTGWKSVEAGNERRVTRCDCTLRARNDRLLAQARIPKRYEHCELSNFEFEGPHKSLLPARMAAYKFVEEYPVDRTGLMLVGEAGRGKTHLAVAIIKELMRTKGIPCLFYDHRELLKEIQNSYAKSVDATEMEVLLPVLKTEVLVYDDLGADKATEWAWQIISHVINTRYNESRTTIITTNFPNLPAAAALAPGEAVDRFKAKAAAREETLGDRIGERMRSRLHEMCRMVKLEGEDFRQKYRSASFR